MMGHVQLIRQHFDEGEEDMIYWLLAKIRDHHFYVWLKTHDQKAMNRYFKWSGIARWFEHYIVLRKVD